MEQTSFNISHCGGQRRLIVFCRYPRAGEVKTRLVPALGPAGAAEVHRRMVEFVVDEARDAKQLAGCEVEICFSDGSVDQMRRWLGADLRYEAQASGDLGARLRHSIARALEKARAVVVIGSDCPELTAEGVAEAFEELRDHDLVIGPAVDGGYYLIGLRRACDARADPHRQGPHPGPPPEYRERERGLFEGIDWGSERVFAQTMAKAHAAGLSVKVLPRLHDVDRPEDLGVWERAQKRRPAVSVIIPALNEAGRISKAIESARSDGVEVIVVDGGSSDRTGEVSRGCGARVISSGRGRGRQMNAGATLARGEILLFLHADSILPRGFVQSVSGVLDRSGTAAGAFLLSIDGGSDEATQRRSDGGEQRSGGDGAFRLVAAAANLRARFLQCPYGDQAIFLKRRTFGEIGGFREIPLMEDLDLVRRLRRLGRIRIVNRTVRTSGRRWRRTGVWKTTMLNQLLVMAYAMRVDVKRLHDWRESERLLPWPAGMKWIAGKLIRRSAHEPEQIATER